MTATLPTFPELQTDLDRRTAPISGAITLTPRETVILVGSDLLVSATPETYENGPTVWPVRAFDSDSNPLGTLGQLTAAPDGAALALFVDLARRLFPGHAVWTA